jgi:hypothetical protein
MDVELPTYDMPGIIPRGKKEPTITSMRKMVHHVLTMK